MPRNASNTPTWLKNDLQFCYSSFRQSFHSLLTFAALNFMRSDVRQVKIKTSVSLSLWISSLITNWIVMLMALKSLGLLGKSSVSFCTRSPFFGSAKLRPLGRIKNHFTLVPSFLFQRFESVGR